MKRSAEEWMLFGVGALMIVLAVFGTMYATANDVTDDMNDTIVTETNLP